MALVNICNRVPVMMTFQHFHNACIWNFKLWKLNGTKT